MLRKIPCRSDGSHVYTWSYPEGVCRVRRGKVLGGMGLGTPKGQWPGKLAPVPEEANAA